MRLSNLYVASLLHGTLAKRDIVGGVDDDSPTPSDMETFFDLCNSYLDTMASCGQEWVDTQDYIVEGITNMSDRIVYTETLILAEAEEIGEMADRIVATEYLMSNLSVACIPLCNESMGYPAVYKDSRPFYSQGGSLPNQGGSRPAAGGMSVSSGEAGSPDAASTASMKEGGTYTTTTIVVASCSPLSAFNEVINASMLAFESLCSDINAGLQFMVAEIGEMADRIVGTECLIMDMSKQIGVMADRIVATENLMANLTSSCCLLDGPLHRAEGSAMLHSSNSLSRQQNVGGFPDECSNYTNEDIETEIRWLKPTQAVLRLHLNDAAVSKYLRGPKDPAPCETWWNPFCCAMEVMTELMVEMMDSMTKVGSEIIQDMDSAAVTIGELADVIIDMEHEIMDMSLVIGNMADDIVDIEAWGLELAQTTLCSFASTAPCSTKVRHLVLRSLKHTKLAAASPDGGKFNASSFIEFSPASSNFKAAESGVVKGGFFGDFTQMVELMIKMASTMETLMASELQEMGSVVAACNQMAGQIFKTMGLISDMADQISIMASRIVTTAILMENLTTDCVSAGKAAYV